MRIMYAYKCSHCVPYMYVRLLESAVEGMRIDVVDRRCRVSETEVKELTSQVSTVSKTLKQLEGQCCDSLRMGVVWEQLRRSVLCTVATESKIKAWVLFGRSLLPHSLRKMSSDSLPASVPGGLGK